MELTAIYHRPESEYAYLYKEGQLHIRIRTKKNVFFLICKDEVFFLTTSDNSEFVL